LPKRDFLTITVFRATVSYMSSYSSVTYYKIEKSIF